MHAHQCDGITQIALHHVLDTLTLFQLMLSACLRVIPSVKPRPKKCKEAIDKGLTFFQAQQYKEVNMTVPGGDQLQYGYYHMARISYVVLRYIME